jgi:hypothetical protein
VTGLGIPYSRKTPSRLIKPTQEGISLPARVEALVVACVFRMFNFLFYFFPLRFSVMDLKLAAGYPAQRCEVQKSNHLTYSPIRGAWVSWSPLPAAASMSCFAAHPARGAPCPPCALPLLRPSFEPSPFFTDRRLRNPATHHHPVHAIRLPPRVYIRLEHHCVLFG